MAATSNVALRKVMLNAARSKEFPEGSIRHGYDFVAPLTDDGHIDLEAWKSIAANVSPIASGAASRRCAGSSSIAPAAPAARPGRSNGRREPRMKRGGRLPLWRPRLRRWRVCVRARG